MNLQTVYTGNCSPGTMFWKNIPGIIRENMVVWISKKLSVWLSAEGQGYFTLLKRFEGGQAGVCGTSIPQQQKNSPPSKPNPNNLNIMYFPKSFLDCATTFSHCISPSFLSIFLIPAPILFSPANTNKLNINSYTQHHYYFYPALTFSHHSTIPSQQSIFYKNLPKNHQKYQNNYPYKTVKNSHIIFINFLKFYDNFTRTTRNQYR